MADGYYGLEDEKICQFLQDCKHLSSRYRKVLTTRRAVMQLCGAHVPELESLLVTLNKERSKCDSQFRELLGIDESQWNYVFRYILASKV